ncbi:MAG TPA: hypothetical protein VM819_12835 [Vicinamibacterales bacterium]|jgi:hypothetical protein|nr:hypothetical protein [Vicinamibacterales bacterium]
MPANRYLNVVLTIIAVELGWLAISQLGVPVSAQQAPTRVVLTGIELNSEELMPVVLRRADVPIRLDASQPLRIQEPVTVRIPVTSSSEFAK